MAYIREVQKGLIEQHGFEKNEYGVPKNVPDGYYPMIIEGKLDHVEIKDGYIDCCNFENEKAITHFTSDGFCYT